MSLGSLTVTPPQLLPVGIQSADCEEHTSERHDGTYRDQHRDQSLRIVEVDDGPFRWHPGREKTQIHAR